MSFRLTQGLSPWTGLVVFALTGFLSLHAQNSGNMRAGVDVRSYRISIRLEEGSKSLTGETRVTFHRSAGIDTLHLTMHELRIIDVRSREGRVLAFDTTGGKDLRIALPPMKNEKDSESVVIGYSCQPRRGMTFLAPDPSFPQRPRQIWTQGQPDHNPAWFPCVNDPRDKACSELLIRVDTALIALGNGRLLDTIRHEDGTRTWHWVMEKPHSDYLIACVVGTFRAYRDSALGVPITTWVDPKLGEREVLNLFGETANMLVFFQNRFGLPYPWGRYAQVPIAEFPHGGMENTTLTTLSDERILVPANMWEEYPAEPLIAHELAHQWWGNLVTYADRTHTWLNEGFATAMQQLWTLHAHGREEYDVQRLTGIEQYLDWYDAGNRTPVIAPDPVAAVNVYNKGGAVLHMLSKVLGEQGFRRLIRDYTAHHAYGSVVTADLQHEAERVVGFPLGWFFTQWLYYPGYPSLSVEWQWNPRHRRLIVRILQEKRVDSLGRWYRLPLTLEVAEQTRTRRIPVEIADSLTVIQLRVGARPTWVRLDPDGDLCGRVRHKDSRDDELRIMSHHPGLIPRIQAAERIAEEVMDSNLVNIFRTFLARESSREARKRIVRILADRIAPDSGPRDIGRPLFLDAIMDPAPAVRAHGFIGLSRLRDPGSREIFLRGIGDSSDNVAAAAFNGLMMIDSTASHEIAASMLVRSSYRDILADAALDWIRRYRIPIPPAVLKSVGQPGRPIALRYSVGLTMLALGHRGEAYRMAIALGDEPSPFARIAGILLFAHHRSPEAVQALRAHERKESDLTVIQVLDELKRAIGW